MTNLPAAGYWQNAARLVSEAKQWGADVRDFIAERIGAAAPSTITLSSDAFTPTKAIHRVDTQGAAAADDLKNIDTTNLADGSLLIVYCVNASRVVTVRDAAGGAGQIHLYPAASTFVLNAVDKYIMFRREGADWYEIGRYFGADTASFRTYWGTSTGVPLSGGTMTGLLILSADPVAALGAATKQYVDGVGYIKIEDRKSSGTNAGASVAATWNQRNVNTEVYDTKSKASVSSNRITLQAGTYRYVITAPAFRVNEHRLRLYNFSDSAVVADSYGPTSYAADQDSGGDNANQQTTAHLRGKLTIASAKTFEIQHYTALTKATNGLGVPASIASITEVYTVAEFEWLRG